jgi:FKBP-type peptidyl-prolyl cis-trans isomerase
MIRSVDNRCGPRLKETLMKTCGARQGTLMLALVAATTAYGSPTVPPGVVAATAQATSPAPSPATMASPGDAPAKPPVAPKVGSYDIGLLLGSQLEHNGLVPVISLDTVMRGLKDAVGGRAITNDERDTALRFMHDARESLADKNRAAGRAFLERNAKVPGIKTMPSGLQYRVIAEGDPKGQSPLPTNDVTVRYRATLGDGTEIDRSDTHDRPATFRVNGVFKGWQEAFLAMKPGAKWQLFVPPELGYGSNPPPMVPPGALLIYEIELLRIEAAAPMDPNAGKGRAGGGSGSATPPGEAPKPH